MVDNIALSVSGLTKKYGKKLVLNSVSFGVTKGSIFGLLGINGAGKTTIIKIIIQLLSQYSGDVNFFGNSVLNSKIRNDLCYLPEKFNPSSYLKGWEFISIALSFFNVKYDSNIAREYCTKLDLESSVLNKGIKHYSKGMGQKLGLLATFMSGRKVLILDEPMSGLDPKARILVKKQIREYVEQGGTVFFSSHILADVDEICDTVAVLHDSNIVFTGTPEGLREKHSTNSLEKAFLEEISFKV